MRLGAVYALERISQDSDRDHMQIMEILCADIQAALTVIGRRAPDKIALERTKGFVLDLRDADLRVAHLPDGDFAQAWFWHSNFQFA